MLSSVETALLSVAVLESVDFDWRGLGHWVGKVGKVNWLLDLDGCCKALSEGLGLAGVCSCGICNWGSIILGRGVLGVTALLELLLFLVVWRGWLLWEAKLVLLRFPLGEEARGVLNCGISSMYLDGATVTDVVFGCTHCLGVAIVRKVGSTLVSCVVDCIDVAVLSSGENCGRMRALFTLLLWLRMDVCWESTWFGLLSGCACTLVVILLSRW